LSARKMKDNSILVETELFEHRKVKPNFINPCCFGEDFAAWLRQKLSSCIDPGFVLSEIVQEDYGWGFWARHGQDPFWIALGYVPDEPKGHWVIHIDCDYGLNLFKRLFRTPDRIALERLLDQVRQVIASNDAMKIITE